MISLERIKELVGIQVDLDSVALNEAIESFLASNELLEQDILNKIKSSLQKKNNRSTISTKPIELVTKEKETIEDKPPRDAYKELKDTFNRIQSMNQSVDKDPKVSDIHKDKLRSYYDDILKSVLGATQLLEKEFK
jgi:hypothetical protein